MKKNQPATLNPILLKPSYRGIVKFSGVKGDRLSIVVTDGHQAKMGWGEAGEGFIE